MKGMIEAKALIIRAQNIEQLHSAVEQVCGNAGFPYSCDFSLADNVQLARQLERNAMVEFLTFAQKREGVLK